MSLIFWIYFIINLLIMGYVYINNFDEILSPTGKFDMTSFIAIIIILLFWAPYLLIDYLIQVYENKNK
jgi:hypothetical protein